MTMTDQESATILKCRYRYANGCAAEYTKRSGLYQHEKQGTAHALHRIELRDCPECGVSCADEAGRSQHLSDEHGIRAATERRQELDARQVQELWDASRPAAPAAAANGHSPAASQNGHPGANGHHPAALDLFAARDIFAALIAEVETLRAAPAALEAENTELAAENTELRAQNTVLRAEAATFARIRAMLAGQDG